MIHPHIAVDLGPFTDSGRTYAVWKVPGRGVVVAFSGTQDAVDLVTDLQFEPQQLEPQQFGGSKLPIYLHGAMYQAATICSKDILSKCKELCSGQKGEVLPLFLTGKPFLVLMQQSPIPTEQASLLQDIPLGGHWPCAPS